MVENRVSTRRGPSPAHAPLHARTRRAPALPPVSGSRHAESISFPYRASWYVRKEDGRANSPPAARAAPLSPLGHPRPYLGPASSTPAHTVCSSARTRDRAHSSTQPLGLPLPAARATYVWLPTPPCRAHGESVLAPKHRLARRLSPPSGGQYWKVAPYPVRQAIRLK